MRYRLRSNASCRLWLSLTRSRLGVRCQRNIAPMSSKQVAVNSQYESEHSQNQENNRCKLSTAALRRILKPLDAKICRHLLVRTAFLSLSLERVSFCAHSATLLAVRRILHPDFRGGLDKQVRCRAHNPALCTGTPISRNARIGP